MEGLCQSGRLQPLPDARQWSASNRSRSRSFGVRQPGQTWWSSRVTQVVRSSGSRGARTHRPQSSAGGKPSGAVRSSVTGVDAQRAAGASPTLPRRGENADESSQQRRLRVSLTSADDPFPVLGSTHRAARERRRCRDLIPAAVAAMIARRCAGQYARPGTQPLERMPRTISHGGVPFRWPPRNENCGLVRGQATGTLQGRYHQTVDG